MVIATKYLPPTNTKGARIAAKSDDLLPGRVVVAFRSENDWLENHRKAAEAIAPGRKVRCIGDFGGYCIWEAV